MKILAGLIAKEAARVLRENPNLKYYEAINEAKKILKEKDPSVTAERSK